MAMVIGHFNLYEKIKNCLQHKEESLEEYINLL